MYILQYVSVDLSRRFQYLTLKYIAVYKNYEITSRSTVLVGATAQDIQWLFSEQRHGKYLTL
jgi:hypothetical protein